MNEQEKTKAQTAERPAAGVGPAGGAAVAKREDPNTSVAIAEPSLIAIARRGDVEIRTVSVPLPPHMQYRVGATLQPTSEGYDYLNKIKGVEFVRPDWVVDDHGERVRNPVHRQDYVYLTLIGYWYNDIGQLTSYREDVEMDYQLIYRSKIVNARSYKLAFQRDEKGAMVMGDDGFPLTKFEVSEDDVLKAQRELFRLRQFGIRAAHTVAKVRILKTAFGIKSLPWRAGDPVSSEQEVWRDGSKHDWIPKPHTVSVPVVGFRDALTPDERWGKLEEEAKALYRQPAAPEQRQVKPEEVEAVTDAEAEGELPFDPDKVAAEMAKEKTDPKQAGLNW